MQMQPETSNVKFQYKNFFNWVEMLAPNEGAGVLSKVVVLSV